MKLSGKIALVTGAGRGIGQAITRRLADEGATVVAASRTSSDLEALAASAGAGKSRVIPVPTDLTSQQSIADLFERIKRECGTLDILVNNAGIGTFAPVSNLSIEEFDRMWAVNVRGLFLCTQLALPLMTKQRSGAIVNIGSLAGKNSFVGGAGYAATKWALKGFADCLRLEVREDTIRVITIFPGSVATQFHPTTSDANRSRKIIQPVDIAEVVLMAVTMPERTMVSEIDMRPTNPK